jgi:hypothetical protein
MRWKVDIHKKRTLDAVGKTTIRDTPKGKLAIALGDSSWSTDLRGSIPEPRRKWIGERLRRVHGVRVIDVSEYNTSQVCNACGEKSLKNAGGKKGKMRRLPIRFVNPYHVRRCQPTLCYTVWNR